MKTIKEIISDYIIDNELDGLFNHDGECACLHEDLQVCDGDFSECIPGIKKTYNQLNDKQKASFDHDCGFFIVAKEEPTE